MSMPAPIDGVPAGLEYLAMIDTITVHQIGGFETKNKYVLKNANGEQVYYAFEESERFERQCCGPGRAQFLNKFLNLCMACVAISGKYVQSSQLTLDIPRGTSLSTEEKTQFRSLKDAGLSGRVIGMKVGRSHCLVPTYLQNSDGYNKEKDARSRKLLQLKTRGRSAGKCPTVSRRAIRSEQD
ncbi:Scramblase [Ancylostoma duodenale]|uniref:Phospholipid scramblase n=1 Tax=Ancylostoma duodenale TaxID=51022 RepID=A0A0C2DJN1_9BILA|nr:Scramblase [Ancylostoma duodenale]